MRFQNPIHQVFVQKFQESLWNPHVFEPNISLLNPTTFFLGLLAPIPIVVYPLIKRYNLPDHWQHTRAAWLLRPQLFLGLTFNWGAMMGYSAVTDNIDLAVQIPLYLGCVAWTVMYDTVYALQGKLQIFYQKFHFSQFFL